MTPGAFLNEDSAEKTYGNLVTHLASLQSWYDITEILEGEWDFIIKEDYE